MDNYIERCVQIFQFEKFCGKKNVYDEIALCGSIVKTATLVDEKIWLCFETHWLTTENFPFPLGFIDIEK